MRVWTKEVTVEIKKKGCVCKICKIIDWKALVADSVQSLSRVPLSVTPWTTARQASLSITNSWNLLKLVFIESVIPSYRLVFCCSFSSCLQSFPASGSFLKSQFFASDGQSIASSSPSVFPMNIQDWFPLGLTGLISLQSKELSGVFSNTIVQKHQFFRGTGNKGSWTCIPQCH